MSQNIAIIDLGIGNIYSIHSALNYVTSENVIVTHDPKEILSSDKIILPGVGAFPTAMNMIKKFDLLEPIKEKALKGNPIWGICVGMQVLGDEGFEFSKTKGLSLISGKVCRLNRIKGKIPVIGWYQTITNSDSVRGYFYFLHSYHFIANDIKYVELTYRLDGRDIVASLRKDNILGTQFHPEKSGESGINLFRDFVKM